MPNGQPLIGHACKRGQLSLEAGYMYIYPIIDILNKSVLNKQKQNHKRYLIDRERQIEMHWTNLIQICDMCLIYIDLHQIIKNKIRIQYTLYTRFYSISPLFGPDIENKHTKLSPVLVQKRIPFGFTIQKKTI